MPLRPGVHGSLARFSGSVKPSTLKGKAAVTSLASEALASGGASLLGGACAFSNNGHFHGTHGPAFSPARGELIATASAAPASAAHAVAATTTSKELSAYIILGSLLVPCSISAESVIANVGEWERLGVQLAKQLGFDPAGLNDVERLRIYHYYLPIYFWAQAQLQAHKAAGHKTALMLGISAPQGCGKSTVVEQLEQIFNWLGQPAASVSIDDFYLTYADQTALAQSDPGNKLLQLRGNAGSHDLALGMETLNSLRELSTTGTEMAVPRYDKSAFSGRGDRSPQASWPVVKGPLDIVFFEGWMSGFAPVSDKAAAAVDADLVKVNQCLRAYKEAWDSLVDTWLVIRIGDPQWVFKWRLQAEEKMKATGKAGMTDAQIADFVARFMPAYKAYLPGLYSAGPTTAQAGKTLIIEVDASRAPVAQQLQPVL